MKKGFYLIEVALALSITILCLSVLIGLLSLGSKQSRQSKTESTAFLIANYCKEKLLSDYNWPTNQTEALYFDHEGKITESNTSSYRAEMIFLNPNHPNRYYSSTRLDTISLNISEPNGNLITNFMIQRAHPISRQ
jgi:uncharacterized protein (TIGR02598 family)